MRVTFRKERSVRYSVFGLVKQFFVASVLWGITILSAQAAGPSRVIEGFASPESVLKDPQRPYVYVSNVGKELRPTAKDGDGFISRLSARGDILEKRYLPVEGTLNAPKGMAMIRRTLFVADIDRIVGFNVDTRQQVFVLDFSAEGTRFLNDLTVIDDKTLMVSATDKGTIYQVSLAGSPRIRTVARGIEGVNGLYFDPDSGRIYVVSFGENGHVGVLQQGKEGWRYHALTGSIGQLDGVALLSDREVLFSDWQHASEGTPLGVYHLRTGKVSFLSLGVSVDGPADFFYDQVTRQLWLPRMKENKVLIEPFPLNGLLSPQK